MRKIINTVLGVLLLTILAYGANAIFTSRIVEREDSTATTMSTSTVSTKGEITKNPDGTNQYINKYYGISFTIPSGWHLGTDELENGTLQLFDYDESVYRKGFGTHENKIEFHVGAESTVVPSSDYPEKKRTSKQITVAGQNTNVIDIELEGGQKTRSYFVPITFMSGKYLVVTIYGDEQNFGVLDQLMKGFHFSK